MKKLIVAILLILSLTSTCLVGCVPNGTDPNLAKAKEVFTLDVNPGLRIYVADDNTVFLLEATNEDGEDIVASLSIEGLDYEVAVDAIIEKIFEKGYLEDTNSVLVSYEKMSKEDIETKVNDKINEVFEKHEKIAAIIAQDVREVSEEIKNMAKEMDISVGKAKLIEAIRNEYPTLIDRELAQLEINDLNIMLEGIKDELKEDFKKYGQALLDKYVSREEALDVALSDASLTDAELIYSFVHLDREDGKMVWEVEFAYETTEYEYAIDAVDGTVIEVETDEYEPFDFEDVIGGFKDKMEGIFGDIIGGIKDKIKISNKQALDKALEFIDRELSEIDEIDIDFRRDDNGAVIEVELETKDGNEYKLFIEASGGTVVKATLNGEELDISINAQ